MKKLLTSLSVVGILAVTTNTVVACGDPKVPDIIVDNSKLAAKFREKMSAMLAKEYSSKKYRLNKLLYPETEDKNFPYLRKAVIDLADKNKEAKNPEGGIIVSSNLDTKKIIEDITENGWVLNEKTLKDKMTELINQQDYSALKSRSGSIYDGLSIDNGSEMLKFKTSKNPDGTTKYNYISLSFSLRLTWYYEDKGTQTGSTSIPIFFQLINDKAVVETINKIAINIGKQVFKDGVTRFTSENPKESSDFNKFLPNNSSDKTGADLLKKIYSRSNLNKALGGYIKSGTTFEQKLGDTFKKMQSDLKNIDVKLNTGLINYDSDQGFVINNEYSISKMGASLDDPKYQGISYDSPFWGLFAGKKVFGEENIAKAYNVIDDIINDKNQTVFANFDYETELDTWLKETIQVSDPKTDLSESSALAFGNITLNGLYVTINGTDYDLGPIYIEYSYSNSTETNINSKGEIVNARNFYFEKLILKEINSFRSKLEVKNDKSTIEESDNEVITISKDTDSAKTAILDWKLTNFTPRSLLTPVDGDEMTSELGLPSGSVGDLFKTESWFINGYHYLDEYYVYCYKLAKTKYIFTWDIYFGDITYSFNFADFFANKTGYLNVITMY